MKKKLPSLAGDHDQNSADRGEWIIALLKAGTNVHATDKNGVTLLHHAVRFRSPLAVKKLIQLGADVNRQCKRSGSTPLHRAATNTGAPGTAGRGKEVLEIIRLLLAAGADASLTNKSGRRPVDYAKDEVVKTMLTQD